MKPSDLIAQLAHCPSLSGTPVVGLDLPAIKQLTPQPTLITCLLLPGDDAEPNDLQNATRQNIRDRFEVLVLLDPAVNGSLQTLDRLHDLRAELWRALVGWRPSPGQEPVEYAGSELLQCDATRVLWRYAFVAPFQLGRSRASQPAESWHEHQLDSLPLLKGVTVQVDAIDPADPNLRLPGPDGRIEMTFSGELNP